MAPPPEIARANGRKGGRPKGSKSNHTLQAVRAKQDLIRSYVENAKQINDALIAKAKTGELAAIKELHDRVYGKSPQALDLTTKGGPISNSEEVKDMSKKFDDFMKHINS